MAQGPVGKKRVIKISATQSSKGKLTASLGNKSSKCKFWYRLKTGNSLKVLSDVTFLLVTCDNKKMQLNLFNSQIDFVRSKILGISID